MAPIPPLAKAEMPQRQRAFWKMTGPGAVLVGLSIGAGEIVIWPTLTAEFGPSIAWAAVTGVFLQLWVNLEIGRWAVATGESCYMGFARVWRGFALAFVALNVLGWFLPAWARISGLALKALLFGPNHDSPDWAWTSISFILVALILFGPKRIYTGVERTIGALVILVTAGLIYIAVSVGTAEHVGELWDGLTNFGGVPDGVDAKRLFSAVVFAGAGGTANLFYAFYLRDKQIGMGARIPVLLNPFRQRTESAGSYGYEYEDTKENTRRFRDWFRFVVLDQTLYFWLLNSLTMLLFIFGAVAVLRPNGIVPGQDTLIWDEAAMLVEAIGPAGRTLFLVIGFATLFSTQLTVVDGVARSFTDLFGVHSEKLRRSPHKPYVAFAIGIMAIGTVLTMVLGDSSLGFAFNAAYMGGFAMALYTPLLLWINLRYLPRSARPRLWNIAMMVVASCVYVGFAGYCLWQELGY